MSTKSIVNIKNLTKQYGNFQLRVRNLEIPEGKVIGLIGENGSGRSTLLNLILNQLQIEKDCIRIFEQTYPEHEQDIKSKIGVILEQNFFPVSFSVEQVERMMSMIYPSWDEKLFYTFIQKFNLPSQKQIIEFSRGMVVKLNFAAALAHRPRLLIADEATSGLDPIIRREILSILEECVKKENMTVVLSSHILSDLEQAADYFIFIHNGEILLEGDRASLLNRFMIKTEIKDNMQQGDIYYKLEEGTSVRYLVVVSDKNKGESHYATLWEILLFLVKGEQINERTTI
ncbi:ATP-binding cassette domain-containing protein [Streptococcus suis]|uniref:ATP-binding cassette domain-containing protein n=1 Tax=Streptococcus suis TaxID=1307 RepID=UPI000C176679|nr:ABC transporter ATP-binding protein [Streptococcus suis]